MEFLSLVLFAVVFLVLLSGYPVAFALAGTSLLFAGLGFAIGEFDSAFLEAIPNRIFGVMTNDVLIAVPLFVFMGVMLERAKIAENLLESMALLFGPLRGGLGIAVILVGMLLAASTGIVGATVVTMGLLALPVMMKNGYDPKLATGAICASGTLGQIIPPSIVLVLLGDVISSAYQQSQLDQGIFSPETVSVGDLFVGALIPGLLLVGLYLAYMLFTAWRNPESAPAIVSDSNTQGLWKKVVFSLIPPIALIGAVLGSILTGIATPTEAASIGAVGAILLALMNGQFSLSTLKSSLNSTVITTSMIFMILIGALIFSLVFKGFGGDDLIRDWMSDLPGGVFTAMLIVMVVMFLLGFFLDFIEITFVVVPIVAPILLSMGLDPIWLGVMIAINLQTSFLTPPFGFALSSLRGVASNNIATLNIYKGVMPFITIQLFALILIAYWPELATWLPSVIYP